VHLLEALDSMDVSVVVPTRNRRRLLSATLCSVLRQRGITLEVIVIDEASTDDTPAYLASLGDPRLFVIRHDTPRGVSTARNRGTAAASGEWVAFVDDDDLWAPDKLAHQLQAAVSAGCDWAYTGSVNVVDGCRIVHGQPPLPPHEVRAALPHYNAVPGGGSNVVVRRSTLLRVGPFDTRLLNTEDWEMWIRLAKAGPPAWVCRPLMAKGVHSSNSSLNIAEFMRGARLIEQLHDTTLDWGRLHRWVAESYLRSGHRRAALGQLARAAIRGQAAGVALDLGAVVRRRVAQRFGRPEMERPLPVHPWIVEASTWLGELQACSQ
jgi:glycosyltransferase involved in cell wall biosynthesis